MIRRLYEHAAYWMERNQLFSKVAYKGGKLLINLFYPLSQRWNNCVGVDHRSAMIVSLTTYPDRISTVWSTIASLLHQSLKPKKVILWLAREQFPDQKLPKQLLALETRGLEIRWCKDLKPHKKYYYVMQENPDDFIVTVDDDVFYPENFLEELWMGHERFPDAVICTWSHEITFDHVGVFAAYNDWSDLTSNTPDFLTLPVGCGGVLYPPRSVDEEIFDEEKIYKLALFTDDLWLKCMELLQGTRAVNISKKPLVYFNNVRAQKSGLWVKNAAEGSNRNDRVWNALMEQYPKAKQILIETIGEENV